jgi:hypothetical protein
VRGGADYSKHNLGDEVPAQMFELRKQNTWLPVLA